MAVHPTARSRISQLEAAAEEAAGMAATDRYLAAAAYASASLRLEEERDARRLAEEFTPYYSLLVAERDALSAERAALAARLKAAAVAAGEEETRLVAERIRQLRARQDLQARVEGLRGELSELRAATAPPSPPPPAAGSSS